MSRKRILWVIAVMDTPKYGQTLRDTQTGMTHKLGKPLVRLSNVQIGWYFIYTNLSVSPYFGVSILVTTEFSGDFWDTDSYRKAIYYGIHQKF